MHHTSPSFWSCYDSLSLDEQSVANKNYELLKVSSRHPALRFKKVGRYWSVRAGLNFRALGIDVDDGILWFWIGPHDEYQQILDNQ